MEVKPPILAGMIPLIWLLFRAKSMSVEIGPLLPFVIPNPLGMVPAKQENQRY
jgi:hypothetical protein